MKIQCSECKSKYNIKDEKVPDAGAKIKCPKCQNIISVTKPKPESPPLPPSKKAVQSDMPRNNQPKPINSENSKPKVSKKMVYSLAAVVVLALLWFTVGLPMRDAQSAKWDKSNKEAMASENKRMAESLKIARGETTKQEYKPSTSDTVANDKSEYFTKIVDNIREIEWGISPDNIPNITKNSTIEDYKKYKISSYSSGENKYFTFFDNKLFLIGEYSNVREKAEMKLDYLIKKFGEGEIKEFNIGEGIEWKTDNITINFIINPNKNNESYVNFYHSELFAAKEEYREKIDTQQNIAATSNNSQNDKKGLAVQGFYIGMPLAEIVEVLNGKHSEIFKEFELTPLFSWEHEYLKKAPEKPVEIRNEGGLRVYKYDHCFIYENKIINGRFCDFVGDENGKTIKIFISKSAVNALFNVEDMTTEKFVQTFIDAYKIPNMEPIFGDNLSMRWEYTSPDGFKIVIGNDKSIVMEKVAKAKERNFS